MPVRLPQPLVFSPDQLFRGSYESVLVDRSEGVGYGQREMLIEQVMNHAGSFPSRYNDLAKVLTSRPGLTGPAALQLARNGDLLLDQQLPDGGDGMVFEYELIYFPLTTDDGTPQGNKLPQPDSVVGTGVRDLGADEEAYRAFADGEMRSCLARDGDAGWNACLASTDAAVKAFLAER